MLGELVRGTMYTALQLTMTHKFRQKGQFYDSTCNNGHVHK